MEEYLTLTLATMKNANKTIYDVLPTPLPTPQEPLAPHVRFQGSINIDREEAIERDQANTMSNLHLRVDDILFDSYQNG